MIHDLLRCQAREKVRSSGGSERGRVGHPVDQAANHIPAATTGKDAAKLAVDAGWGWSSAPSSGSTSSRTVLDLITDRETTARQRADRLREQITALTGELARLDGELADLATTRTTLRTLAADEFTADDPTIASGPYQQILHILGTAPAGMRAKGICLALGVEPSPKNVEAPAPS